MLRAGTSFSQPGRGRPAAIAKARGAEYDDAAMPDYKVQLDVYNGPLDLLLYLIRRNELDIYDIPIAAVTRQYCEYVSCLQQIDPDAAAEFVVMATVLMEIKSRTLLPGAATEGATEEALDDPRMELVRQLLEYKKYKDASIGLGTAAALQAARWPRSPILPAGATPGGCDLDEVQVWDLVAAFNNVMASIGRAGVTHDVVFDDTPIALHATDILDRLAREGNVPFAGIFIGRTRAEAIGLFLALLELIRQQRVRVEQPEQFGPIFVVLLRNEPITIGTEWEYRPRSEEASDAREEAEESAPVARGSGGTAIVDDAEEDERDEVLSTLDSIRTDIDLRILDDATARDAGDRPLGASPAEEAP